MEAKIMAVTKQLLFDTDVVIDFLRGQRQAVSLFKTESDRICFSCITISEIYAGTKDGREETDVERLFSIFPVLEITREIARMAGQFVRRYGRSYSVEIPDALIAATCSINHAELQTLNVKHYPMFHGIVPPYRKS
jgi:predicted nucleic acid-binding protein